MKTPKRWEDVATLLVGLQLASAPWVLDYQGDPVATANAVGCGSLLLVVGLATTLAGRRWLTGLAAAAALWLLVSPSLLGFVNVKWATFDAEIAGGLESLLVMFSLFTRSSRELPWARPPID